MLHTYGIINCSDRILNARIYTFKKFTCCECERILNNRTNEIIHVYIPNSLIFFKKFFHLEEYRKKINSLTTLQSTWPYFVF